MNPPVSLQASLAAFMKEGHFQRHLRKMRKSYELRCRWLVQRVEAILGEWMEVGVSDGGMHFVGYYKRPVDAQRLAEEGRKHGYVFLSISSYGPDPVERDGMMFCFSSFSEERMEQGLRKLREALERCWRCR